MYKPEQVAQKAYETFARSTVNQGENGAQHPRWDELTEQQRHAWLGVVHEVTSLTNAVESRASTTEKDEKPAKSLHKHAHAAH
jgi:hypothetical protein